MANPTLVLASASPRRVALLQQLQLPFEQIVSPVEEPPAQGDPETSAILSARTKAGAVADLLRDGRARLSSSSPTPTSHLVIGADTVVSCAGQLLGKPADEAEAAGMLRLLSGRQHTVCTGIAVVATDGEQEACEITRVLMKPLSETSIAAYVASGEPQGKAGSYAIQGLGARFIERVEGCYYNVVGLPLARLCCLLESAGFDLDLSQETE
ncbi:MAG TPA: Maf family protein [Candidatus Latescibacteria bacterium]|jgi:septum formation protein|nr:septum formation protein Maf [Gemmatimonadaceae bacterium]MDP6017720.1 Maf family protein [Candidatus Latescibacterota bacterium]HJP31166.1 Maf family protein [Candidatus Latescibacterota bacterium]|tara:strand:+ start:272 stop:904 length:633 start_codon:yes stop_codon:yes gene_type:complete